MSDSITIEGGIRIALRRSARARRMTLRVPRAGGDAVLTLPHHVTLSEGRAFAERQRDWLLRATSRQQVAQTVIPGAVIPIEGQGLTITPSQVRAVTVQGPSLLIPHAKPVGVVVQAFLKHLAHDRLRRACDDYSAALGRPYTVLALRDTRSRWGSCNSEGRLMFSWRLAMAPPVVLRYVAAHEVAHLAHMDHSPRFWAQVGRLMPDYRPQRDWLRQNGSALQAWRFRD
ncbi:M48 family metallopeptidase [Paracoccus homiensis]|uniref:YgjP-like metallopeptidase domain-containing protein n=1 Tax=Paracoccus homiensis TaxID=364199 RepID=A0A1I0C0K1_9RHOB|nr:SprT family zinc-dependent metalloprotease [Paracoccus homiensis]SET12618.1 hypothetical protein SAMN04489858_103120 [Paracoccus homiensis]